MRKKFRILLLGFLFILTLAACIPGDVKEQAKKNKNDHENDFVKAVEEKIGSGYVLSDVEPYITTYVSDYEILPSYSSTSQLTGKLAYNGKEYDAMYNFDDDELYTDTFTDEILSSVCRSLGLNPTEVKCGCIFNHDNRAFNTLLCSDVHSVEDLLIAYKKNYVVIYIVTSEDVSNLDFKEYMNLCELKGSELTVNILTTDDFQNEKHFLENCYGIHNDGGPHPVVYYKNESTDVFSLYNLNGYVSIDPGAQDKLGDMEVITY